MADNISKLEKSLVKTISESDLADIAVESLDAILDELPVPFFSTLRKLIGGARSVRNYYFAKKVIRYLTELHKIPVDERRPQIEKLLTEKERERFGEHVILLLDRLNDVDKSKLMGLVSVAFLREQIDLSQLRALNFLIDAVDIKLVAKFDSVYDFRHGKPDEIGMLVNCGLLSPKLVVKFDNLNITAVDIGGPSRTNNMRYVSGADYEHEVTELALLFDKVCLKPEVT